MTPPLKLTRYAGNPVLLPSKHNPWETDNVFNAAVVQYNGLVYMHSPRAGSYLAYWVRHQHRWLSLQPPGKPVLEPAGRFEVFGVEAAYHQT